MLSPPAISLTCSRTCWHTAARPSPRRGIGRQQRVRHWAAIAHAALRPIQPGRGGRRAERQGEQERDRPAESAEEADEFYRPQVLDAVDGGRLG